MAQDTMDEAAYDRRMMTNMNDRTLYIRSLPGYPGGRSDLYEVYMEPYYFVSLMLDFRRTLLKAGTKLSFENF